MPPTCVQCISQDRLGCDTTADCCNSLPCQRNRAAATMGTCQRVSSSCRQQHLRSAACVLCACLPRHISSLPVLQRNVACPPMSALQCIALTRHGCSQSEDCCNSRLCQKDAASSPLGSCQKVSLLGRPHRFFQKLRNRPGKASCIRLCSSHMLATYAPMPAQCIAELRHGCRQKADCCGGNSCVKEQESAIMGSCAKVGLHRLSARGLSVDACCCSSTRLQLLCSGARISALCCCRSVSPAIPTGVRATRTAAPLGNSASMASAGEQESQADYMYCPSAWCSKA